MATCLGLRRCSRYRATPSQHDERSSVPRRFRLVCRFAYLPGNGATSAPANSSPLFSAVGVALDLQSILLLLSRPDCGMALRGGLHQPSSGICQLVSELATMPSSSFLPREQAASRQQAFWPETEGPGAARTEDYVTLDPPYRLIVRCPYAIYALLAFVTVCSRPPYSREDIVWNGIARSP